MNAISRKNIVLVIALVMIAGTIGYIEVQQQKNATDRGAVLTTETTSTSQTTSSQSGSAKQIQSAEERRAEKCEAWCKEHRTCNIDITAHAVPQEQKSEKQELNPEDIKSATHLFYGVIGVAASLAFFLLLYWALSFNSSITMLIQNTKDKPLYLWPYAILTALAIILFGINAPLFTYRWRKFGAPKLKSQGGAGFGTFLGFAASACPMCGSTVLAALGIAGGLAAFPLGGLELKALSVGLLALPIWPTRHDLKKLECGDGTCPAPRDASFKETDRPWLIGMLALIVVLSIVSWRLLKTEPFIAKLVQAKDAQLGVTTAGEL